MPVTKITLEDLKKTACWPRNEHLTEAKKARKQRKPTKEVRWVESELKAWCEKKGFELIPEYRFNPLRKWRVDFYIKQLSLCIEYEGIMSEKSRHTSKIGYSNDVDKYNNITELGFKLLRFTVLNHKNIIEQIERL